MAQAAFGSGASPPEDQHSHVLGFLACGLAAAAATALALEDCARANMMHTFTGGRLAMRGSGAVALVQRPGNSQVLPAPFRLLIPYPAPVMQPMC